MKKNYLFPEAQLILLLSEDIITTSDEDDSTDRNDDIVKDTFAPRAN